MFVLTWFVGWLIPDLPADIALLRYYETTYVKRSRFHSAMKTLKTQMRDLQSH